MASIKCVGYIMEIFPPQLSIVEDKAILSSRFICQGKESTLWFSFDKGLADYAVLDRSDAFLVALLPLAMHVPEDVHLHHPVSGRILYNIREYLIPLMLLCVPDKKSIKIEGSTSLEDPEERTDRVVATGLSCGVDSFFTLAEHSRDDIPDDHKITHCVFMDVGSHGRLGSNVERELFEQRLANSKKCASELGLKMITIESNLSTFLPGDYVETHTLRNSAAILALEKRFSIYYYSAGQSFLDLSSNEEDLAKYETLVLSYLSTKDLQLISSGAQFKRSKKTEIISGFEPSHRYLNVCTKSGNNCSVCNKCLRTELTLDVLGRLDLYGGVFDLKKYQQERKRYIGKVRAKRSKDLFSADILELMKERGQRLGFVPFLYSLSYRMTTGLHDTRSRAIKSMARRKRAALDRIKS